MNIQDVARTLRILRRRTTRFVWQELCNRHFYAGIHYTAHSIYPMVWSVGGRSIYDESPSIEWIVYGDDEFHDEFSEKLRSQFGKTYVETRTWDPYLTDHKLQQPALVVSANTYGHIERAAFANVYRDIQSVNQALSIVSAAIYG